MKINRKENTLWITRTAVFIALLIVLQVATASLGNTLVTGAIVNMLLIVSVMTCGLLSGITVSVVSPVVARFFGIGSLWSLIPFIAVGNVVLILLWHFIGNKKMKHQYITYTTALLGAAVAKFAVLYIAIVRIAVPVLLRLPKQQAVMISKIFSVSQLITALTGGALAVLIFPRLKKIL
jgi:hypothetical protein